MAREEERRAEAKMVRGEVERLDRWQVVINISIEGRLARLLKARLPSGELKRGKSFRRKARRGQEDKEAVNMSGDSLRLCSHNLQELNSLIQKQVLNKRKSRIVSEE